MTRLLALAPLVVLAGCETPRALSVVSPRVGPTAERTFDLPEEYDILDVHYMSALVALDDDPDSGDVRERSAVQVFAQHRETGEEVLFVFDLMRPGSAPSTVVRFRRAEAEAAPEAEARPRRPVRDW